MNRHLDHAKEEHCPLCEEEAREEAKKRHPSSIGAWRAVLSKLRCNDQPHDELNELERVWGL